GSDDAHPPPPIDLVKDWNSEFHALLREPDSMMKFEHLAQLAQDFAYCAETYGKIIISEMMIPDDRKTIKPTALGGIAGGQKYLVQGILFKFSLDLHGLYG